MRPHARTVMPLTQRCQRHEQAQPERLRGPTCVRSTKLVGPIAETTSPLFSDQSESSQKISGLFRGSAPELAGLTQPDDPSSGHTRTLPTTDLERESQERRTSSVAARRAFGMSPPMKIDTVQCFRAVTWRTAE